METGHIDVGTVRNDQAPQHPGSDSEAGKAGLVADRKTIRNVIRADHVRVEIGNRGSFQQDPVASHLVREELRSLRGDQPDPVFVPHHAVRIQSHVPRSRQADAIRVGADVVSCCVAVYDSIEPDASGQVPFRHVSDHRHQGRCFDVQPGGQVRLEDRALQCEACRIGGKDTPGIAQEKA